MLTPIELDLQKGDLETVRDWALFLQRNAAQSHKSAREYADRGGGGNEYVAQKIQAAGAYEARYAQLFRDRLDELEKAK